MLLSQLAQDQQDGPPVGMEMGPVPVAAAPGGGMTMTSGGDDDATP